MKKNLIQVHDTIEPTAGIKRHGYNSWEVKEEHIIWLRIFNPGQKARIKITIRWSTFMWMRFRKLGYLEHSGQYRVIPGELAPGATTYAFEAPGGESFFGPIPWHTNEDNLQFLAEMSRQSPLCSVRSIGKSAEGREIKCLTIADNGIPGKKRNVVVIGREHATESAGTWAVMGTARYLVSGRAPRDLFKHYNFHLFPNVNPDGTAHGLRFTRPGPAEKYDMEAGGLKSNDPSIKALRMEIMALKPVCFISHHSFLFNIPLLGVYNRKTALALVGELIPRNDKTMIYWMIRQNGHEPGLLRWHCYRHFHATAVLAELPWTDWTWSDRTAKLPEDVEKKGADIFRAAMIAHERTPR